MRQQTSQTPQQRPRRSRWALLAAALVGLVFLPASSLAQEEAQTQTRAERATVFIMQTYDADGTQALSCVGSGTLISPTGLILTNAHLALSLGPCRVEKIVVGDSRFFCVDENGV